MSAEAALRYYASDRASNSTHPRLQVDLLSWYENAKRLSSERSEPDDFVDVIMEGLEIVEEFSRCRQSDKKEFSVDLRQALHLLSRRVGTRGSSRPISSSKLIASTFGATILRRMIDKKHEEKEGHPLLCLLHVLWLFAVDDFNGRCSFSPGQQKDDLTLEAAKTLLAMRPTITDCFGSEDGPLITRQPSKALASLIQHIDEGEKCEQTARQTLAKSKILLRECFLKTGEVPPHIAVLKELLSRFRSNEKGLLLDRALEQELDQDLKTFTWLVRQTDSQKNVVAKLLSFSRNHSSANR